MGTITSLWRLGSSRCCRVAQFESHASIHAGVPPAFQTVAMSWKNANISRRRGASVAFALVTVGDRFSAVAAGGELVISPHLPRSRGYMFSAFSGPLGQKVLRKALGGWDSLDQRQQVSSAAGVRLCAHRRLTMAEASQVDGRDSRH
jgi:hypothetical protein